MCTPNLETDGTLYVSSPHFMIFMLVNNIIICGVSIVLNLVLREYWRGMSCDRHVN